MVACPNFTGHTLADGRFTLLNILGSGTYGTVYKAIDAASVEQPFVAIKCLKKQVPGSRQEWAQKREFALHHKVNSHPNIINFYGCIQEGDFIFVILDLCDGDLYAAIKQESYFINRTDRIKSTMIQLIDALQYCHKNSVFHRDLKPDNILFDKAGQVYLADFGLSTNKRVSTNFGCGSRVYLSPECIGKETGSQRFSTLHSDIWALGVILINIITGSHPWAQALTSDPCFNAYLKDPEFLSQVLPISASANLILRGLFEMNPLVRTSLSTLRKQILAVDTFFAAQDPSDSTAGPVTPESKPIEVAIEVSDMPEGQGIGEIRLVWSRVKKPLPLIPELDQILRD
ncbi:kinase-like domain-containing protein [Mycena floridula]|nr:kinase-like domain-containing protein [Mycena floridula]